MQLILIKILSVIIRTVFTVVKNIVIITEL